MKPIKLVAFDHEDLEIISAHLQDAIMRVDDMKYLPEEKRFAAVLNRFDWMGEGRAKKKQHLRRRAGLDFGRILGARERNIRQKGLDNVLELLSVQFKPDDLPAGWISLVFAGGGEIELQVECIEARLSDLGPVWETQSQPEHNFKDE